MAMVQRLSVRVSWTKFRKHPHKKASRDCLTILKYPNHLKTHATGIGFSTMCRNTDRKTSEANFIFHLNEK